jgi:hypothetical protein
MRPVRVTTTEAATLEGGLGAGRGIKGGLYPYTKWWPWNGPPVGARAFRHPSGGSFNLIMIDISERIVEH